LNKAAWSGAVLPPPINGTIRRTDTPQTVRATLRMALPEAQILRTQAIQNVSFVELARVSFSDVETARSAKATIAFTV